MAKFYAPLPYTVPFGRGVIRLTPAFDNVLAMYEALDGLLVDEYIDVALHYLTKNAPRSPEAFMAVMQTLFPKQVAPKHARSFDFIQDSDLIYAAFWQTYGIDLDAMRGKLHWWKFNALLGGLPSNTRFVEVVQIRLRELPKPNKHNHKEIQELLRLKQEFALKISEEERQQNLQAGFQKMAMALLQMVRSDDNTTGKN